MADHEVGFVGLGNMGGPMARRLIAAGIGVRAFDVNAEALRAFVSAGGTAASTAVEVADAVETIFVSLPNGTVVEEVVLDAAGIINGQRVKRVIDFSTVGPRVAVRVAGLLAEKNITYVDAPVSGGVPGAIAGKLTLMVACPEAVLNELSPLMEIFGEPFHVAETAGHAQMLKLANNLLSAAALAISSEAMVIGAKAGLDPQTMLDVINAGSGRNSATQDKFPRSILPGTFDYGFSTGLALKDVRLCLEEAQALEVPTIVGAAVKELLSITQAAYGPRSDYTSMCRTVESWANVKVRSRV